MWAVGIAHTYPADELRAAGADAVLDGLDGLDPAWVERFFAPEVSPMTTGPSPRARRGPAGLLLSRDLIFTSKVTGTARALGHRVMVAGDVALASAMIEQWHPRVVFVDLAAGDLVSPAALLAYQKQAGPAPRSSPSARTSTPPAWPPRRPPAAIRCCPAAGSRPSCPT